MKRLVFEYWEQNQEDLAEKLGHSHVICCEMPHVLTVPTCRRKSESGQLPKGKPMFIMLQAIKSETCSVTSHHNKMNHVDPIIQSVPVLASTYATELYITGNIILVS